MSTLLIGLPSKGRLKEQVDGWLADCGLPLQPVGGARGYRAAIAGLPDVEVQLLSASDIAAGLDAGDLHLGVTGEDLLRERGDGMEDRVMLLRALGFGRADLVVAAPQSWIDVRTMADLDEVAAAHLARTGRRMRVATKYGVQTRGFFHRRGVADYRIVDSGGATEGAPAAGFAELIVDITTTGATLSANGLRPLDDGVILKSQAHLAAALRADWSDQQLHSAGRLLSAVEARARAAGLMMMEWPKHHDDAAREIVTQQLGGSTEFRSAGAMAPRAHILGLATALAAAGVGPVSAHGLDYVFESACSPIERLKTQLGERRS